MQKELSQFYASSGPVEGDPRATGPQASQRENREVGAPPSEPCEISSASATSPLFSPVTTLRPWAVVNEALTAGLLVDQWGQQLEGAPSPAPKEAGPQGGALCRDLGVGGRPGALQTNSWGPSTL